jgi:hypothetical protein
MPLQIYNIFLTYARKKHIFSKISLTDTPANGEGLTFEGYRQLYVLIYKKGVPKDSLFGV